MYKLTVLYPNQPGKHFDHDYYVKKHMPLCHKRLDALGLESTEVFKGLNGGAPGAPAPFVCIGTLTFNTVEAMQKGMATHGGELVADIPNFTDIQPQMLVSEVLD